jgi:hypothetical protein
MSYRHGGDTEMKAFLVAWMVVGCAVAACWFVQRSTRGLRSVTIEAVSPDAGRATARFETHVSSLAWPLAFPHGQPLPAPPHNLLSSITVEVQETDSPNSLFNVYELFQCPSGPFLRLKIPEERPEDLRWLPVASSPSAKTTDVVNSAILLLASLTVQPVSEIATVSPEGTLQSRHVPQEFPESLESIPVLSGGK